MKNKQILVGTNGRPSMRQTYAGMKSGVLTEKRGWYYNMFINNSTENFVRVGSPSLSDAVVVRWGTREVFPSSSTTIIYNNARNMSFASDKKLGRLKMESAGVNIPKLVTERNVSVGDFPIIARPSRHAGGKNLVVINSYEEFLDHYHQNHDEWYYSAFFNKDREFRYHVAHGRVLLIREKPRPKDGGVAWNQGITHDSWRTIRWNELDEDAGLAEGAKQAINAVEALGLDFGGVDVMVLGDEAKVLEVNTAPTIYGSKYACEKWGKYFDWLFRSEKRRPHFDTSNISRKRDYIFYNRELNS